MQFEMYYAFLFFIIEIDKFDKRCDTTDAMYWVVRKIRADFEGKLKRRRFKFHLLNLNLLRQYMSSGLLYVSFYIIIV